MLLHRLRAHTGDRTITLTAPGGDLPGARAALPTTVGNLLREAAELIEDDEHLDRATRNSLLAGVPEPAEVVAQVPARHSVWLAWSASQPLTVVPLAPGVRVRERVLIDDQVAIVRPLLEHEQRGTELLVLTLSDQAADLAVLHVADRHLDPVGDPFPFTYAGDGTGTQDRSSSSQRDERRRHHWRRVAEAAHTAVQQRDLPVVTVGVDRNQAFLREVSSWPEELAVGVLGAPEALGPEELMDRVIAAAGEHRQRRIDEVAAMIAERETAGRLARSMTDLYAAAVAGRIELLVLVDGPPVPGYLTDSGHLVADDPGGATFVPDAYALGVAEALRRGGEVLLAPEGTLESSIATLRW
ncbi:MAG: hypothetical protein ACLFV0_01575 [Nitriliruptoraceae bacterium]